MLQQKNQRKHFIQKPSGVYKNQGLDLFQSLAFFLWFLEFFLSYKTEKNHPVLQKNSEKRFKNFVKFKFDFASGEHRV